MLIERYLYRDALRTDADVVLSYRFMREQPAKLRTVLQIFIERLTALQGTANA